MRERFESTFEYKLIYIFRINDESHSNMLKIGDASIRTNKQIEDLINNCRDLNEAAKRRINEYTATAGIAYELLHTELAIYSKENDGIPSLKAFRDHDVHRVLKRSCIEQKFFDTERKQNEWFLTDLETAKNAIKAVKESRASLLSTEISQTRSPIVFRPEQEEAIKKTIAQFNKSDRMLWNAKMRFGKTLSALEVARQKNFNKTLIYTHRPVVSDSWYEDFYKIFEGTDYIFGSKEKGEPIENLLNDNTKFVYFASIQDLRGSQAVGGKFEKNEYIFLIDWDLIVIDEAHEGTKTTLGMAG